MKILLFLSMLVSNFIYSPSYCNDFFISLEERDSIEEKYTTKAGDKISFYYMQNYLFTIDDTSYSCIEDDKDLYIAYVIDDKLYLKIYEDNSKLKKNVVLTKYVYIDCNIKLVKDENNIYLFSTIERNGQLDILVYQIDDSLNIVSEKIYEGSQNETFLDVKYINETFYILLEHDNTSYGDFGLGGVCVLSKQERDLSVVKNIYFKEEIKEFKIDGELISLISKSIAYQYDLDLTQIIGFKINNEALFTSKSISEYYLNVYSDHVDIYNIYFDKEKDTNKEHILKTYEFSLDSLYLEEIIEADDKFYLVFSDGYLNHLYELKIYDLRNFVESITYLDGITQYNNEIYTWFKKLDLISVSDNYNTSINGEYEVEYSYDGFSKKMELRVLEEENVKEGMIYPINYHLFFTGTAFLNSKMIHNNYCITEEGKYKLDLYSNTKELRTINFTVSNNQLEFQDETYTECDFSAKVDQEISLVYNVKGSDEISLIIDNEEYDDYVYKDNTLKINFTFSESGFYKKVINEINGCKLEDIITFNIFTEDPNIIFNLNEERKKLKIDYYNEDSSLRIFKLYLDGSLYKTYPLSDTLIVLPHERDYNEVKITVAYDIGSDILYEKELSTFLLNDTSKVDLAKIIIQKKEAYLEEYEILINDKSFINKIKCEDKIIYENIKEDNQSLDLALIVLSIVDVIALIFIFYKTFGHNLLNKIKLFKKNKTK